MVMNGWSQNPAWEAFMSALIDVDQLRTFIAIVETGSFTKAAEVVHKTQSAVSMQMKRLEERLGKAIFARDGRASKLTEDGDRLLDYARRIIKLNVEALAAFDDAELAGRVRLGLPDDYADRYLPEIMARFSRAYPSVELTVTCEPSVELVERIDSNELDLAIVTDCGTSRASEVFRRERLLWVTSNRHSVHLEEPLPLALGRPSCGWRRAAIDCLETMGRPHHIAYTSANASAVASAVLAGLAPGVTFAVAVSVTRSAATSFAAEAPLSTGSAGSLCTTERNCVWVTCPPVPTDTVKASTLESSSSRTLSIEPCRAPNSIRYSSSCEVTDSIATGALPIARLSARGTCTKTHASG